MPVARPPGKWPKVAIRGLWDLPNAPFLLVFLLLLSMVCLPALALADRGDWSVGCAGALGLPADEDPVPLRLEASTRLGLSDWVGLEAGAAFYHEHGFGVQAELGLVAAADIFQWVPEALISGVVSYGAGANGSGHFETGMRAQVRARYFLSLRSAVSVGVGGTWLPSGSSPFVRIGWQSLFN